jgi:hypothetical protein
MTFVLVAVDGMGENITASTTMAKGTTSSSGTTTVDEGQMSPPYPASKTL